MSARRNSLNPKTTIKDIARLCNVSTQTISRVINQRPDVSPETRERILEVIDRLGYQPSALARSLIQQRSYSLGVIIAGLKYIGISQTLNGITDQANQDGYSLLLEELPNFNVTDTQPVIRSLIAHQVEAIIYAAPQVGDNWQIVQEQCPRPAPPMVFLKGSPLPGISTVSIDNFLGAYQATTHLLEQGCRRIAHITGPMDWWEARERFRGWKTALEEAGLPPLENQWVPGNWSPSSGEKAFQQLLENYADLDGVFVANDQMSLAVLHVAAEKGISVPQQLAVVGFDDLAEGPYFIPPLTTVKQDFAALGVMAVRKALEMVNGSVNAGAGGLPDTIILPPQLVVRSSSLHGGLPPV